MAKLGNAQEFDPTWYKKKFKDVELLDMDPAEHFLRFGALLNRSPGPEFNMGFYRQTYQDARPENCNPLLVHIDAHDRDSRAKTFSAATKIVADVDAKLRQANPDLPPYSCDISYCIPIAGRLDDVKGTLEKNLEMNAAYAGRVEFLVIELGADREVYEWAKDQFPGPLQDGYLRIIHEPALLDGWHFGRAKNAFRDHIRGHVYSSLDGDNFVTSQETEKLLEVLTKYPLGFVMHHFSGAWGDGTSGRVSMPAWLYRDTGYGDRLMPRQFDEMDFLLGALKKYPFVPFIGISRERNAFTLSKNTANFFDAEKMPNCKIFVGDCARLAPLNPRGETYTDDAPYLRDMNNFNAAVSAFSHGTRFENVARNLADIAKHKHRLIESMPAERVLDAFFETGIRPDIFQMTGQDICVITCMSNETVFLQDFLDHYRSIGVTHFLIVDDGSDLPIATQNLGEDVYAFRPKVGDFRTSKTLWMETLLKAAGATGHWALAVDADEFLQVPQPYASLRDYIDMLDAKGLDFAPGLLLDMVPNPETMSDEHADAHYADLLDHFFHVSDPPTANYLDHASVKWGFGPHAQISWRADARYHLFETFDSLRKLPLFRVRPDRHLNQGFHTFHFEDQAKNPTPAVWQDAEILPIYHYKLYRLFSDTLRQDMLEAATAYHSRTSGNIAAIFSNDADHLLGKLNAVKGWLQPKAVAQQQGYFQK